jgi:hypothetical protein
MIENEAVSAALEARLEALEEEIDRLSRLASSAKEVEAQQQYWNLARDAQIEARNLRKEFRELKAPASRPKRWPVANWFKRSRGSAAPNGRSETRLNYLPSSRTT